MKTASRRRFAFWGVLGTIGLAALVVALMPHPIPVDEAAVTRGSMRVTLDHEGRTRVRERYVVSAPVPGRVLRIELEPGDRVEANRTVLATFLPAMASLLDVRTRAAAEARVKIASAALEQARAQRDRARTESRLADVERDRTRQLEQDGLATEQARLAAEADAEAKVKGLAAAESAVAAASGELEGARAALIAPDARRAANPSSRLSLRSPIDGVVLRRMHESEAEVPQGEPLLEIADLGSLEVIADYLSSDAVRITPGMPAEIDQWGGGSPLAAHVRRVEPAGFMKLSALGVEEQRVWVILDFADPREAWRSLGDGYRVEARVVTWQRPDVVKVPTASLFRSGSEWAVFVVKDGRAAQRVVRVGHRNGTAAAVLEGLQPGEHVVVHPPDTLTDGARVEPRG